MERPLTPVSPLPLRRALAWMIGVPGVMLILMGLVMGHQLFEAQAHERWVRHSLDVQREVGTLRVVFGAQRYALFDHVVAGGDRRPLTEAEEQTASVARRLLAVVADNPPQRRRAERLLGAHEAYVAEARNGLASGSTLAELEALRPLEARLNRELSAIAIAERELLHQRQAAATAVNRLIGWLGLGGILVACGFMAVFGTRQIRALARESDARVTQVNVQAEHLASQSEELAAQAEELGALYNELRAHSQRVEELVALRTAALEASESRLAEAQRLAGLGAWEVDLVTRKLWWSEELYRLFGLDPGRFEPSIEGVMALIHPQDLDRYKAYSREVLAEHFAPPIRLQFLHASGKVLTMLSSLEPLYAGDGRPVGLRGTLQDLTERVAIERMKDEFVAVVSHELRTPLTSIRGSLGLLASGRLDPASEKGRRMLEIAVQSTDRLVRLINDILDVERIEGGKLELERSALDAGQVAESAMATMSALAEQAGVSLACEVTPGLTIDADADRLHQALVNLLSNAIKFSPAGQEVSLTIAPDPDAPASWVQIVVADHGRGIPEVDLERIFERFQQVDTSDAREKGGTGLGLAIVRAIAIQHGGTVHAESEPGSGARFVMRLPREAEAL